MRRVHFSLLHFIHRFPKASDESEKNDFIVFFCLVSIGDLKVFSFEQYYEM